MKQLWSDWKVTFDTMFTIIFRQHKANSVYSCNVLIISNIVQLLWKFIAIKLFIGTFKLGIQLNVHIVFQVNYHSQGSEGLF